MSIFSNSLLILCILLPLSLSANEEPYHAPKWMVELFNEPMLYDPVTGVRNMGKLNSSGVEISEGTGKGVRLLGNSYWQVNPSVNAISQIENMAKLDFLDKNKYFYVLSQAKTDEQKAAVIALKIRMYLSKEKDAYVYFEGTNYFLAKVAVHNDSFLGSSKDPRKLVQNYINKTITKTLLINPESLDIEINNIHNIMRLVKELLSKRSSVSLRDEKKREEMFLRQGVLTRSFWNNDDEEDDDGLDDDEDFWEWFEWVDDWMEDYERDLELYEDEEFYWSPYENDYGETCALVIYEYDLDGDDEIDETFIEDDYFCETL
ncbi:hypothetical protein JL49_25170 [Pseudoalteromonas luteoviolacea]|nr:hypothetical protein JL49_25170 [Pseudoalteromonas luteoviolacea]